MLQLQDNTLVIPDSRLDRIQPYPSGVQDKTRRDDARWDAATEEDYEKAIEIVLFNSSESRVANHLQQELRDLRLKRIGI